MLQRRLALIAEKHIRVAHRQMKIALQGRQREFAAEHLGGLQPFRRRRAGQRVEPPQDELHPRQLGQGMIRMIPQQFGKLRRFGRIFL